MKRSDRSRITLKNLRDFCLIKFEDSRSSRSLSAKASGAWKCSERRPVILSRSVKTNRHAHLRDFPFGLCWTPDRQPRPSFWRVNICKRSRSKVSVYSIETIGSQSQASDTRWNEVDSQQSESEASFNHS